MPSPQASQLASPKAHPLLLTLAGLLSGLVIPFLLQHPPWLFGLLLGLGLGLADWQAPRLTAPLWQATEWLGKQLGHYNGILLSAALYILVIAPLGLMRRLFHSPVRHTLGSFYQAPETRPKDHMKRMF